MDDERNNTADARDSASDLCFGGGATGLSSVGRAADQSTALSKATREKIAVASRVSALWLANVLAIGALLGHALIFYVKGENWPIPGEFFLFIGGIYGGWLGEFLYRWYLSRKPR